MLAPVDLIVLCRIGCCCEARLGHCSSMVWTVWFVFLSHWMSLFLKVQVVVNCKTYPARCLLSRMRTDTDMSLGLRFRAHDDTSNLRCNGGWVTTRFTSQNPLPTSIWKKWLQESYELSGNWRPNMDNSHNKCINYASGATHLRPDPRLQASLATVGRLYRR